jgi:nicotinamide mononucleotide (NMN) deamidase PncC
MSFLTDEQKDLANEIAALLTERGETVCVAESTTGGLVSAALLWVAGASKYYAGGSCSTRLARARRWRVCRHRCLRTTAAPRRR